MARVDRGARAVRPRAFALPAAAAVVAAVLAAVAPSSARAQNTPVSSTDRGLTVLRFSWLTQPGTVRVLCRVDDPASDAQIGPSPAASDFSLHLADGRASLTRAERFLTSSTKTHTVVAIDHSLSFKGLPGAEAHSYELAAEVARNLRPGQTVSLLLFGEKKTSFPPRTTSTGLSTDVDAAKKTPWDPTTRLYDGLLDVIEKAYAENPSGVNRILLVTDGDEESKAHTWNDVAKRARERGVFIHVVLFKPTKKLSATKRDALEAIARETSGELHEFVDVKGAKAKVADWSRRLDNLLSLEAGLRCMSRKDVKNTLRVDYAPGGQRRLFTRDVPFDEQAADVLYDPKGGGDAQPCPVVCAADAECPVGQRCAQGTCAPAPAAASTVPWWWWLVAGILVALLLGLLLGLLLRKKPEREQQQMQMQQAPPPPVVVVQAPPPAPPPPVQPPPVEASSPGGSLPSPVEALPDFPATHLVVMAGPYRGLKYSLFKRDVKLGGAKDRGNDHVFDVGTLSGEHAVVQVFPSGDMWVRDLESRNGTFVNEVRVPPKGKLPVRPGDQIRLGPDLVLRVERPGAFVGDASPPVTVPPPAGGAPSTSASPSPSPSAGAGPPPAPSGPANGEPPKPRVRKPTVIDR